MSQWSDSIKRSLIWLIGLPVLLQHKPIIISLMNSCLQKADYSLPGPDLGHCNTRLLPVVLRWDEVGSHWLPYWIFSRLLKVICPSWTGWQRYLSIEPLAIMWIEGNIVDKLLFNTKQAPCLVLNRSLSIILPCRLEQLHWSRRPTASAEHGHATPNDVNGS